MSRNLETRIVGALKGGLSASKLAALADETEFAIGQSEASAHAERRRALDPLSSPDPRQARATMEDAAFRSERLRSLLPRLQARYEQVAAAEERAEWKARYQPLKRERDALADELAEVYPQAVAKLMDLFGRIAVNDSKLDQLHRSRPSGVPLHLIGAELKARGLNSLSTSTPSIAAGLQLPAFTPGAAAFWPPPQVPLSVLAAASVPRSNAGRWFEDQRARAAAERADARRVADYYARSRHERRDRENRGSSR